MHESVLVVNMDSIGNREYARSTANYKPWPNFPFFTTEHRFIFTENCSIINVLDKDGNVLFSRPLKEWEEFQLPSKQSPSAQQAKRHRSLAFSPESYMEPFNIYFHSTLREDIDLLDGNRQLKMSEVLKLFSTVHCGIDEETFGKDKSAIHEAYNTAYQNLVSEESFAIEEGKRQKSNKFLREDWAYECGANYIIGRGKPGKVSNVNKNCGNLDSTENSDDDTKHSDYYIENSNDTKHSDYYIDISDADTKNSDDHIDISDAKNSDDQIDISDDDAKNSDDHIDISDDDAKNSDDHIDISDDDAKNSDDHIETSADAKKSDDHIENSEDNVENREDLTEQIIDYVAKTIYFPKNWGDSAKNVEILPNNMEGFHDFSIRTDLFDNNGDFIENMEYSEGFTENTGVSTEKLGDYTKNMEYSEGFTENTGVSTEKLGDYTKNMKFSSGNTDESWLNKISEIENTCEEIYSSKQNDDAHQDESSDEG